MSALNPSRSEPIQLTGKAKKVTIILARAPGDRGKHNYLAILERLRAEGAAGATVFKAMASFGARAHVHTLRLADVSPDLPVMIVWVDTAEQVERILPKLWDMVTEGLITIEDTNVLLHTTTAVPDLPRHVPVRDVMTRDVVAVRPETPLSELVADLVRRHFRAIPVIDADRHVIGIVTSGDLVRRGLATRLELLRTYDPSTLQDELNRLTRDSRQTREVMTSPVETVQADAEVRRAAELMRQHNLRRLPVVDREERLVGVVSRVDLLRAIAPVWGESAHDQAGPAHVDVTAPARTIMSTAVPTVHSDAPLAEVVSVVLANRMKCAVVVDSQDYVLGIIRDLELTDRLTPAEQPTFLQLLLRRIGLARDNGAELDAAAHRSGDRARDLMVTDIVVAHEDEPIRDVLAAMMDRGRTIVPVVNETEQVVGVIYRTDVLDALVEE